MTRRLAGTVGLLMTLSIPTPTWAELGKLVREEIRPTPSGTSLLVCVYAVGGRETERVYPVGNFCPQYVETK